MHFYKIVMFSRTACCWAPWSPRPTRLCSEIKLQLQLWIRGGGVIFNVVRITKIFKLVMEVREPVRIMITTEREMTLGGGGLVQSWWMVSTKSKREKTTIVKSSFKQ